MSNSKSNVSLKINPATLYIHTYISVFYVHAARDFVLTGLVNTQDDVAPEFQTMKVGG